MTRIRRRLGAPVLLALLVLTAGCADQPSDPRAAASAATSPSGSAKGFCPPPEDTLASPSPCISYGWDQRVAENHAFREAQPITAGQRQAAQPRATALAAALRELADKGTTLDGLRTAAAGALGLEPRQIEVRGDFLVPLHDMLVGGGEGRVCVNGTVDSSGHATAEVVGRTVEGTCLPGPGGH
ncbi:precorrin-3B C(17)-methyltransferase [Streptomyces zaehneri]|uniref:precorrin-3B C(17)-methyltransferase n=1 Tax=Streptomyces zaehneri TaxID=3051180 RepID=UPI0028D240FC|nr:precorrin-3B C(17)-methyltransferase [Streptomyces sp. DSM 40713]